MNADAFLESVSEKELKLRPQDGAALRARAPESIDALFHLPLLALAVMVIARRTPFQTFAMGRSVALLLAEHFSALRRSPHGLETSLTLRRRCAEPKSAIPADRDAGLSASAWWLRSIAGTGEDGRAPSMRRSRTSRVGAWQRGSATARHTCCHSALLAATLKRRSCSSSVSTRPIGEPPDSVNIPRRLRVGAAYGRPTQAPSARPSAASTRGRRPRSPRSPESTVLRATSVGTRPSGATSVSPRGGRRRRARASGVAR